MAAFDPIKAVVIHAQVPVDSDIGLRYGAETQGLLLKSAAYKPTRTVKEKMNHREASVMQIHTTPKLVITFDAEVLQTSGVLAMLHPGEAISKANVQEFYADAAHGFNTAGTGYFIADSVTTTANPGDLFQAQFDLRWFTTGDTTVNLVSAP